MNNFISLKSARRTASALILTVGFTYSAFAYPLIEHNGAINPTTEGFSLVIGAGGTTNAVAPDGATGYDAWQTFTPTSSPGGFAAYVHNWTLAESNTLVQLGWQLHLRLRVTTTNDAVDGGMQVEVGIAGKGYAIDFGSDASGNPVVGLAPPSGLFGAPLATYTVAGAAGQYVYYTLVDTNASGTFRLFANGTDTGLSTTGFATSTDSRLYFGDGTATLGQNGGANWNWILLEVPEPSVALLAGLGITSLLLRRWKQ